jgi:hypothetical protein
MLRPTAAFNAVGLDFEAARTWRERLEDGNISAQKSGRPSCSASTHRLGCVDEGERIGRSFQEEDYR